MNIIPDTAHKTSGRVLLNHEEIKLLLAVYERGGTATLSDLGKDLGLSRSANLKRADKLVAKQLLTKEVLAGTENKHIPTNIYSLFSGSTREGIEKAYSTGYIEVPWLPSQQAEEVVPESDSEELSDSYNDLQIESEEEENENGLTVRFDYDKVLEIMAAEIASLKQEVGQLNQEVTQLKQQFSHKSEIKLHDNSNLEKIVNIMKLQPNGRS
ncbi:hypothetical protein ACE1B6_00540 [Aerosakkonemataceae cyanobacterium BLCC-F154]|uniref:MarR family transcriptional regulator n=1 Tax=Floridaenema fluviatile BLCC-F154 TaxID=3153640 RepID=A0ABV4Y5G1_9CYAN